MLLHIISLSQWLVRMDISMIRIGILMISQHHPHLISDSSSSKYRSVEPQILIDNVKERR